MIVRALLGRERRSVEWGSSAPPPPGAAGNLGVASAGVSVTDDAALALAAVWSCVSLVSDAVATMPVKQYRGVGPQRQEVPLAPIIADPFVDLTQQDWIGQLMVSTLLRGNFYGEVIERDRLGFPVQVQPWHPDRVAVRRSLTDGTIEYRFDGRLMDRFDVVHLRGMSVPGSLVGLNPVEYARTTVGLGRAADLYAAAFFANSAHPSGVIQTEQPITPEAAKLLAQQWKDSHQGVGKAQMPAVLSGATWQSITLSPKDAMFIESRQLTAVDACALFRVPPHMIGLVERSTSWGTGIQEQEMGFARNTLRPWTNRIEALLSSFTPRGQYVRFDFTDRLRPDLKTQYEVHRIARETGVKNVNDIRADLDLPPLPDDLGADYLQPLNYAPVGSPAATGETQPAP